MKAPSARLSPACSVSQARPSVISSRLSMNSSSLLRRATTVSHQRITRWPPHSSSEMRAAAFRPASSSAVNRRSGSAPSAGISTSSGTTAKSCSSSTPITRWPCSESSSSRSTIIFTTMAVLLMAIAPDSASAVCQPMCQRSAISQLMAMAPALTSAIVSTTCASPRPNTCRRMARSLGRLNSSPITNIRNTTPNSARYLMLSASCPKARPSVCGSISTPATR